MKINKDKFISFRVTRAEKNELQKKTEDSGFSKISAYVRDKLGL